MAKVFIAQMAVKRVFEDGKKKILPAYDVKPAEKYGEPVYVFKAVGESGTGDTEDQMARAKRLLKNFNPAEDSVLASGSPDKIMATAAIIGKLPQMSRYEHSPFYALVWDKERAAYDRIRVDL